MRKPRKVLLGLSVILLLGAVAIVMPAAGAMASAKASDSPVASESKKKCKKKKKSKKCKKRKSGEAAYLEGRYSGTYSENNTNLLFNVAGGRVYTGPFDSFFIEADCTNLDYPNTVPQAYTDPSAVEPVQASIANGSFSGSGLYTPGFGLQIAWTVAGQIAAGNISGGTFSVNYTDTYGNPCSGTTHFTAQWYAGYTL